MFTTTDLRSKTSRLVRILDDGGEVLLLHRSKVIGEIIPKNKQAKILTGKDISEIKKLSKNLHLSYISDRQIEKRYRLYLKKRYGKRIS